MSYKKTIQMTVHGANLATFPLRVEVGEGDEKEVTSATVPCWEVELTTDTERHGTIPLRFTGGEMTDAQANFVPGAKVSVTLEVTPPQAASASSKAA